MSSNPVVSVIIAAYNHEPFVRQAIESVLAQTYPHLEAIALDDGSTDRTLTLLQKIKDKRLRVIGLKENRRFHPRNKGISLARGKYIAFQNSDDVWDKEKLSKQVTYLERHPKVGAVFSRIEFIDARGRKINKPWAYNLFATANRSRIEWLRYFLEGNGLCISSAVVRRELLTKVGGFDESLVQLSDLDLWIRLAARSELYILPEVLTQMRIVPGRNYSTPTKIARNRHGIEFIQVLGRYAQEPIISQIGKIIPGKIRSQIPLKTIQQCRLIRRCWQLGSPEHLLFSVQLCSHLLAENRNRSLVTAVFGADFIRKYISLKGQIKISLMKNLS